MLRVTVEIVPFGEESRAREIGRMVIANTADHPNRPAQGNYSAQILTIARNGDIHANTRRILDFDRLRGNVWRLIHAVLVALGEEAMESEPISLGETSEGTRPS